MTHEKESSRLARIEAKRAARKANLDAQREEQLATDLEAIDLLEEQYGDSNIRTLEVPFTPGLPVLCAVRTPDPAYIKRHRETLKPKRNAKEDPDAMAAAIVLGAVARVYPDAEVYAKLLEARPGIDVQLGLLAAKLVAGKIEETGKE